MLRIGREFGKSIDGYRHAWRAKQADEKGNVMNRRKEPGTAFLFALSQEFGKSVDSRRTTVSEKGLAVSIMGLQPSCYHRIHAWRFGFWPRHLENENE
jgi:hypothetical protein